MKFSVYLGKLNIDKKQVREEIIKRLESLAGYVEVTFETDEAE